MKEDAATLPNPEGVYLHFNKNTYFMDSKYYFNRLKELN